MISESGLQGEKAEPEGLSHCGGGSNSVETGEDLGRVILHIGNGTSKKEGFFQ